MPAPVSVPPATEPGIPDDAAASEPEPETERDPDAAEEGEFTIPVEFVPPEDLPELELDVALSRLRNLNSSSFYKLQARLHNASDSELQRLSVQVELFAADGRRLDSNSRHLLMQSDSELRPGDRQAFGWTQAGEPELHRVRIVAQAAEALPAADDYAPSQPVSINWQIEPPSELQLAVRERQVRRPEYGDSLHHIAEFELTNTGGAAFKLLRVQIEYFDATGRLLASRAPFVVSSSKPPLLPDETRLLKTTQTQLPLDFDRYELTVVDWE
ncbi:MAG: hypothetical protein HC838_04135 [Spirulinaceae cyanobacterium RM2_2_10]|nr:hypothetical protein [Spirulinaceae cyanobacterium RM2_2_10]